MTAVMAAPKEYGALSIRHAGKVYDPDGINVVAVQDCSIDIGAGEFAVIVGPSGCGKTTLLNIIAGFDTLTTGEILMDGEVIAAPRRPPTPGADRIVVFQNGSLFPWKTVLDNITYGPLVQRSMSMKQARLEARGLLARVGLSGLEDKYPGELSSGVQRRVEILRALINDPKVVLLDEPFRALDAVSKSVMHNFLLELFHTSRKTMFFITHDLDEAIFLGDVVIVMTTRPGRIKKTIRVNLPRPRDYRVLNSDEYIRLKEEALEAVHEEALKAFQAGERELA